MSNEVDLSIFENVDVSDPVCSDNIFLYLEEMQEEDEEFMEVLVNAVGHMEITWQQPWYQKTGWLTRRLEQKDEEDKFSEEKMCKAEIDSVHQNWLQFVKEYDVPNKPLCLARWRNKDKNKRGKEELARRFVISYLAKDLKRNLNQIFLHFVAHYAAPNRGKYTDLELKVIQMCIFHFPKGGIQLASRILSREPRGIYRRLALDREDKSLYRQKIKWNLPLATKFLKLLMRYSGYSLEQLKYKRFDTEIWKKLEEHLDKYYICLQRFWYFYLHVQLFVKCDIKIQSLRKDILKKLRQYPYQVWTDINWKELQKHFPDGVTNNFLYDTTTRVVYKYKNYLTSPIEDVIDYGLKKIKKDRNKRLKTLALNHEGMLELVRYTE